MSQQKQALCSPEPPQILFKKDILCTKVEGIEHLSLFQGLFSQVIAYQYNP